jgi:hypothetical protein
MNGIAVRGSNLGLVLPRRPIIVKSESQTERTKDEARKMCDVASSSLPPLANDGDPSKDYISIYS